LLLPLYLGCTANKWCIPSEQLLLTLEEAMDLSQDRLWNETPSSAGLRSSGSSSVSSGISKAEEVDGVGHKGS